MQYFLFYKKIQDTQSAEKYRTPEKYRKIQDTQQKPNKNAAQNTGHPTKTPPNNPTLSYRWLRQPLP